MRARSAGARPARMRSPGSGWMWCPTPAIASTVPASSRARPSARAKANDLRAEPKRRRLGSAKRPLRAVVHLRHESFLLIGASTHHLKNHCKPARTPVTRTEAVWQLLSEAKPVAKLRGLNIRGLLAYAAHQAKLVLSQPDISETDRLILEQALHFADQFARGEPVDPAQAV